MVSRSETGSCPLCVTKSHPYLGHQLGSIVRNNVQCYAMESENMFDHELSDFEDRGEFVDDHKMSSLQKLKRFTVRIVILPFKRGRPIKSRATWGNLDDKEWVMDGEEKVGYFCSWCTWNKQTQINLCLRTWTAWKVLKSMWFTPGWQVSLDEWAQSKTWTLMVVGMKIPLMGPYPGSSLSTWASLIIFSISWVHAICTGSWKDGFLWFRMICGELSGQSTMLDVMRTWSVCGYKIKTDKKTKTNGLVSHSVF